MTILVTGGAGYIGSHVVKALGLQGEDIVVLDNLSTGHREAVLFGTLVVGDLSDSKLLDDLFKKYQFESVMHFAGSIVVPESVQNPLKYYRNNTLNSALLLEKCLENKTKYFIFSSTAAVYAMPEDGVCSEDSPLGPNNPYGHSKFMTEQMIWDLTKSSPLKAVALRYFNVAGADPDGQLGQSFPGATSLIKVVCEAAAGKRDSIEVFGTDYPTKDGTGVRDFIHVSDLASAHLSALEYLKKGGETTALNCGYGHGFSVREIVQGIEAISGIKIRVIDSLRRKGDFAKIISNVAKIESTLGWMPKFNNLKIVLESSYLWEIRETVKNFVCES